MTYEYKETAGNLNDDDVLAMRELLDRRNETRQQKANVKLDKYITVNTCYLKQIMTVPTLQVG